MYAEALNTYQVIVKNKMFSNAGMVSIDSKYTIRFDNKDYPNVCPKEN